MNSGNSFRKLGALKTPAIMSVLLMGMAGLATATVISNTTVDTMVDQSYWYQSSATTSNVWQGTTGLDLLGLDPNDAGNVVLQRGDTNVVWFSYKTGIGKLFDSVQIAPVYGAGWDGVVALEYLDTNAVWTAIAPTTSVLRGAISAPWSVYLDTYDLSSIRPSEVKVIVSGVSGAWQPVVSSVTLDVVSIPEPTTMALLSLGGLLLLRKRKQMHSAK